LLLTTNRKLDKAASKGVIHKNQAANKKSALARTLNKI
jgi:small subunit ribosomal protein S20